MRLQQLSFLLGILFRYVPNLPLLLILRITFICADGLLADSL